MYDSFQKIKKCISESHILYSTHSFGKMLGSVMKKVYKYNMINDVFIWTDPERGILYPQNKTIMMKNSKELSQSCIKTESLRLNCAENTAFPNQPWWMPDEDKILFCDKVYLVIKIYICYNASRQKVMTSPFGQKNESPNCVAAQFGDSSCFL